MIITCLCVCWDPTCYGTPELNESDIADKQVFFSKSFCWGKAGFLLIQNHNLFSVLFFWYSVFLSLIWFLTARLTINQLLCILALLVFVSSNCFPHVTRTIQKFIHVEDSITKETLNSLNLFILYCPFPLRSAVQLRLGVPR